MSHAAVAKAAKDEEAKKVAAEDAFKTRFSIVLDKLEQVRPADLSLNYYCNANVS